MKKTIFIPMEIKARELDSRLLVGLELAQRGHRVFLGEKNRINQITKERRGGIYFAKSGSTIDLSFFKTLKSFGHKITVLDEEAIIHQNETAHIKSRLNRESIDMVDTFFSWGPYDQEVATKTFPDLASRFLITGNPRIDLLRKELRDYFDQSASRLNAEHGGFILIPSSFAMCNHHTEPGARIEWRRKMGMIETEKDVAFYQAYVDHFERIFRAFLEDLPKLAKAFPDELFIVRPHPSENRAAWEKAFVGMDNIKVIAEGPIVPWLCATKLVIHNGCTTAIESFLLDKPVIAYRPHTSDTYDLDVPNSISMEALDYKGLIDCLQKVLSGELPKGFREQGREVLGRYLASLEGDFAYKKIASRIEQIDVDINQEPTLKQWIRRARRVFIETIKREARTSYSMQKFDSFTNSEINERVAAYSCLLNSAPLFKTTNYSKNIFLLER